MIRTQVQLTEEQVRKLRAIAREQGLSLAEVVRRCIDRALSDEAPTRQDLYARANALIGAYNTSEKDLATRHDDYLDEAFE